MSDESQKPVTQAYRDNWDRIWGAKTPCSECGGNGTGPDKIDGPGDVYQDACTHCNGTGQEP